jgi:hypothetical protein
MKNTHESWVGCIGKPQFGNGGWWLFDDAENGRLAALMIENTNIRGIDEPWANGLLAYTYEARCVVDWLAGEKFETLAEKAEKKAKNAGKSIIRGNLL